MERSPHQRVRTWRAKRKGLSNTTHPPQLDLTNLSPQSLQGVSDCFDKLEDHASILPMYYLLRTGLYKTITLIGRSRPISVPLPSYPSSDSLSTYPSPSSSFISTPSPLSAYSGSGEEWKGRAAALSWCWTGRVIECAEF